MRECISARWQINHRIFDKAFDDSNCRLSCYNTSNYFEDFLTIKCNIMLIDGNPTKRDQVTKRNTDSQFVCFTLM